ncbi:hypothetical protein [Mycoplasma sp. 3686d]|uniref:hypothetical protein n=1 Tax=Mycoplasma sp. 3686d TaxID=2967300 RepID=UPI00211B9B25|nr:hypothetical protein [Mycoplasma sp. 3686d]UUM24617.1 hypothetical protein NPA12_02870 [Mycoplasma sp. 3686d]
MKKLKNKLLILSSMALVSAPILGVSAQVSNVNNNTNQQAAPTPNTNQSGTTPTVDQALQTKKTEYKSMIDKLAKTDKVTPFLSPAQISIYKTKADTAGVTSEQIDQFLAQANSLASAMLTLFQNASSDLYDKLKSSTHLETKVSDEQNAKSYKTTLMESKTEADKAFKETTKTNTTFETKEAVQPLIRKFVDVYTKGVVSILEYILDKKNHFAVNSVITSYLNKLLTDSKADLASSTPKLKPEHVELILMADSNVAELVTASAEVQKFVDQNQDLKSNVNKILDNTLLPKDKQDMLKQDYDKLVVALDSKEDVNVGEKYFKDPNSLKKDIETLSSVYTELKTENDKTQGYNEVISDAKGLNDQQKQEFAKLAKTKADQSQDPSDVKVFEGMIKPVNDEMLTLQKNLKEYEPKLKELLNSSSLPQENKDSINSVLKLAKDQLTKLSTDAKEIQSVSSNVPREYSRALEVSQRDYQFTKLNQEDPKPTYYEYIILGAVSTLLVLVGLLIIFFKRNKKDQQPEE